MMVDDPYGTPDGTFARRTLAHTHSGSSHSTTSPWSPNPNPRCVFNIKFAHGHMGPIESATKKNLEVPIAWLASSKLLRSHVAAFMPDHAVNQVIFSFWRSTPNVQCAAAPEFPS